jgi:hypothetical protein
MAIGCGGEKELPRVVASFGGSILLSKVSALGTVRFFACISFNSVDDHCVPIGLPISSIRIVSPVFKKST